MQSIRREAPRIGGSFAVWGGLFSTFDCTLVAVRKKVPVVPPLFNPSWACRQLESARLRSSFSGFPCRVRTPANVPGANAALRHHIVPLSCRGASPGAAENGARVAPHYVGARRLPCLPRCRRSACLERPAARPSCRGVHGVVPRWRSLPCRRTPGTPSAPASSPAASCSCARDPAPPPSPPCSAACCL